MNEWQLKIDLNIQSIEKLKNFIDKKVPTYFIDFLKEANASYPKKDNFKIDKDLYVLNSILDFNEKGINGFYEIYENLKDVLDDCIPFGRDGMGNYVCLNLENSDVYFYNHENEKKVFISIFDDYIKSLY